MNRTQLFQTLAAVGGLRRVISRDGLDKIVVVDPWLVANTKLIRASQWLLGAAVLCVVLGLLGSARGFFLGAATDILMIAMLVRLAAPAASGLPTWNDFIVLGDSSDFADAENIPVGINQFGHEEDSFEFRNTLAAAYALVATAATPTRNAADTALKGLTNFTNAQMTLLGAEALWNMRKRPSGFFAMCTGLGMFCVVAMMTMLDTEDFSRSMILIGPFAFWTGAILYALSAPKWFRGRIMPYHGNLVMHQNKILNGTMSLKVTLGLAASAMVSVHIWAIIAFTRYVVANTGIREHNPLVESNYPTPVPRVEHALLAFPLSVGCGLAVFDNYGKSTSWWLFVLALLVPGTLGLAAMLVGRSTDIVRYLSEGPNSLILLDPAGVQNAENNERFPPAAEARIAAQVLDQALDAFFAANSGTWPHKFRPPASKQATATSDT